MGAWNAWRELRHRPRLRLRWVRFSGKTRGRLHADGRLELDSRLNRRAREATLAHELVHDERRLFYDRGTPPALIEKEEVAVNNIVAMRMVPFAELAELVARAEDDEWGMAEPVTAELVAEEFDTTSQVASLALKLFAQRRHSPNHPSWREWR